jgi:hypothetical protein
MNYIYILLICLIGYYIISNYLKNHLENFDPSLVPVSSIVTLAKVAQKLVDGGGTLTNPGNLTLGTATAPGNLIVTGTTKLDGNTKIGGELDVTGVTRIGGGYNTALIISPRSSATGALKNNGYQFFSDKGEKLQIYCNATGTEIFNLDNSGSAYFNSNIGSNGTTTMGAEVWHKSTDGAIRLFFGNKGSTFFGSQKGYEFRSPSDTTITTIDKDGNATINGSIRTPTATITDTLTVYKEDAYIINTNGYINFTPVDKTAGCSAEYRNDRFNLYMNGGYRFYVERNGDTTITGQLNIVPRGSIMMWYNANIPAGWALCNGQTVGDITTPNMTDAYVWGGNGGNPSRDNDRFTNADCYCGKPIHKPRVIINFIMKV